MSVMDCPSSDNALATYSYMTAKCRATNQFCSLPNNKRGGATPLIHCHHKMTHVIVVSMEGVRVLSVYMILHDSYQFVLLTLSSIISVLTSVKDCGCWKHSRGIRGICFNGRDTRHLGSILFSRPNKATGPISKKA